MPFYIWRIGPLLKFQNVKTRTVEKSYYKLLLKLMYIEVVVVIKYHWYLYKTGWQIVIALFPIVFLFAIRTFFSWNQSFAFPANYWKAYKQGLIRGLQEILAFTPRSFVIKTWAVSFEKNKFCETKWETDLSSWEVIFVYQMQLLRDIYFVQRNK